MTQRRIAVDFDGVIHDYKEGYKGGVLYGDVVLGTRAALATLTELGFEVYIFTSRLVEKDRTQTEIWEVKQALTHWLEEHGIYRSTHYHDMTGHKIGALAYIDDRGIRFTNWPEVMLFLNKEFTTNESHD